MDLSGGSAVLQGHDHPDDAGQRKPIFLLFGFNLGDADRPILLKTRHRSLVNVGIGIVLCEPFHGLGLLI